MNEPPGLKFLQRAVTQKRIISLGDMGLVLRDFRSLLDDLEQAEAEREALKEVIETVSDTPLGEPMGIIKRQLLGDALKGVFYPSLRERIEDEKS